MTAKTRKLLVALSVATLLVATALEVLAPNHHLDDPGWKVYWWNRIPAFFYGLLGFAGCVAIVVVSKVLGKLWLQRPESYYDDLGDA